ncbi:copper resistance protein B [Sphingomonas sp. DT-207]|uniref:copper resistance protein B n=1 Tax=Sphingomonas sp. DT-207 TaxID=3396167 RepID=UPI003F1D6EF5
MTRLPILLLALATSAPALAQHAGHGRPPEPQKRQQTQTQPDPHAGHTAPAPKPAPAPTDPHAGHTMPAPADSHAGHDMPAQAAAPASPPPEATTGPLHAADGVYSPAEMAKAREAIRTEHGGQSVSRFMIDQLEVAVRGGRNGYAWEDVQFWYGGDIDKLWIKSQGEGSFGGQLEKAEVQALWSHAISPYFDLQAGVRYDIRPQPDRGHLVLGVQGLAPYWFELDAAAFVSEKGDASARIEGEYDLRITQKLILQPNAAMELTLQDLPELRMGSGLSTAEAGLRLRYEFVPEFAPYAGVQYERAFGNTADFRRSDGEDTGGWSLVLGVRAWF